ncbi:MAG: hypothetical protein WCP20_22610 [Desulfuromonadales bacterium]
MHKYILQFSTVIIVVMLVAGCGTIERTTPKISYEELDMGKKLPMTCRVSFAPSVDKLRATAGYQMKVSINNEKQNEQLGVAMGAGLKESLLSALRGKCSEVIDESSAIKSGGNAAFNPYNTTVVLEVDPDQPVVSGQGAAAGFNSKTQGGFFLNMKTRVTTKTVTGEVFGKDNYLAKGTGKLEAGGAFVGGMAAALTLGHAADAAAGQQLVNGAESVVADLISKIIRSLNADFSTEFTEFTAYSAAMKSKSVNDLQTFLDKYPRGKRARKVAEALDTQMYEFAKSTNMLESNIEYLDKMPKGKYRAEMKAKVEPLMYDEIAKGNTFFCKKYLELLPDGDNAGDVRKLCGVL